MDMKKPGPVLENDVSDVTHFNERWTVNQHLLRERRKFSPEVNFRAWIALRKWEWVGQRMERFKYVVVFFGFGVFVQFITFFLRLTFRISILFSCVNPNEMRLHISLHHQ